MKRLLDIDQLLIFALLAVTVNQMGHYLAGFAPPGLRWIGYCQAVAIDAAIWRSAYWFRRYGGRRQRHWSLAGVVLFSLVSAWYNRNYYAAAALSLGAVAPWLMGAVLPGGVALLSYLLGQKDESRFATSEQRRIETPIAADNYRPIATNDTPPTPEPHVCESCGRSFRSRNALNAHGPQACAAMRQRIAAASAAASGTNHD